MNVGQFLFDCLKDAGITEIFGVPGDYNFSLLDILEHDKNINFVNCRNELNAGYAADGYARIKGLGALITTFGVGELSACNAIAGAYSESVPIIHIVGAPNSMVQKEHKHMHHSLLDGNFDVFKKVYENITAYTAVVTCENAGIEIPNAVQVALETKKPVYLVVAMDIAMMPVRSRAATPGAKQTDRPALKEALKKITDLLQQAKRPVLIPDVFVARYGLEEKVEQLAESMKIPVVNMMMGKGAFNERHPNYKGFYCGKLGSEAIRELVETADCIIAIGAVWDDYNTGLFTAQINPLVVINIMPDDVKVGAAVYPNVLIQDLLDQFPVKACPALTAMPTLPFPFEENTPGEDKALSAKAYYPEIQQMIKEDDIIVAEAGTFVWGLAQVRLKEKVAYLAQGGWGSIGYALPAAFGAGTAAPKRRVLLFTGEGSLQINVQELSSMLGNGCRPIIFVLNNKGYTIEKEINQPSKTDYNNIPNWNYRKLPEVFGGEAYAIQVRTNKEFHEAIVEAEKVCHKKLCLIEMITEPMDVPEIMQKMHEVVKATQG